MAITLPERVRCCTATAGRNIGSSETKVTMDPSRLTVRSKWLTLRCRSSFTNWEPWTAHSHLSPTCLTAEEDTANAFHVETLRFERDGVALAGRLFMPREPGPHPAVVLLHGGGLQRHNEAPLFFAPLLAQCGVAALFYDKRGTGASEGAWEDALFDDFVDDAAAAVEALDRHPDIDDRIGLIGFSQGGRLAPLVAVRHGQVDFIVSVSGPFASLIETRLYSLAQQLQRWSLSGSALDSTTG